MVFLKEIIYFLLNFELLWEFGRYQNLNFCRMFFHYCRQFFRKIAFSIGKQNSCRSLFLKVNISPGRWYTTIKKVARNSIIHVLSYDIFLNIHVHPRRVKKNATYVLTIRLSANYLMKSIFSRNVFWLKRGL